MTDQPEPLQIQQSRLVDAAFDEAASQVDRAGVPRAVMLPGLGTTLVRWAIAEWGPAKAAQWLRTLADMVDALFAAPTRTN